MLLVGGIPTPLKNMSSSIGMIVPNIWKNVPNHQSGYIVFFRSKKTPDHQLTHCQITTSLTTRISLGASESLRTARDCGALGGFDEALPLSVLDAEGLAIGRDRLTVFREELRSHGKNERDRIDHRK